MKSYIPLILFGAFCARSSKSLFFDLGQSNNVRLVRIILDLLKVTLDPVYTI